MFLLNSPPLFFTETFFQKAPLLPKLRGYFAEFLNCSYLDSLRIFSLTTCVRSRYGYLYVKLDSFLENMIYTSSLLRFPLSLVFMSRGYKGAHLHPLPLGI